MNPVLLPQIAALLSRNGTTGINSQAQEQPQKKLAYFGSIPEIAKAREADPQQLLANSALANGASTAPVAGGSWAWADGIARALSGVAGGYINKQADKKYAKREQDVMEALKQAAALASTPQPAPPPQAAPPQAAPPPPPVRPPAPGVASPQPGSSFNEAFAPFADRPPAPQMPPAGGLPGAPASPAAPAPPAIARAPLSAPPMARPGRSRRGASDSSGAYDVDTLFMKGIVAQEGVQNKDGTWQTSFKGAVGPAQVMPGTAPEAARLAGLPYDEKRYRTDPEYNLALGRAYYAAQLERFGDPAKAAAAYNAGPGAVARAERRARRSGGSWTDYLPKTTKDGEVVDSTAEYVQRFNEAVGGSESQTVRSGQTVNENIEAVGPVAVPTPQMEAVPEMGKADYVPPEVQSNRIAMAQAMLNSGNPDLVVMARAYLDQGLTEQNDARMQRNSQQFNMGATERGFDFTRQQAATDRNFDRESNFTNNSFNAAENAASREQQARLASADQAFTSRENAIQREWQSNEAQIERNARMREAEIEMESRQNGWYDKDPLWTTVGGEKIREELRNEDKKFSGLREKILTFLSLNENQPTGGIRGVPGVTMVEGWGNDAIKTMDSLANQITIEELGGLGVAISDGDREFVSSSMLSTKAPGRANRNNAEILLGLVDRKLEYNQEYLRWRAENGPRGEADFNELWNAYKREVPVVLRDGEKARRNSNAPSFREWVSSIPVED